ncbi:MAG: hypothetical protein ACK5LC_06555 [Coprobacillaceae bacterium]
MSWIDPNINWTGANDEYFDPITDYNRIKGNIEYLHDLGQTLYPAFSIVPLETITLGQILTLSYFNNVPNGINSIKNNTFTPVGYQVLKSYAANKSAWDYRELNKIENNILLLNQLLTSQKKARRRLSFRLGGGKI